MVRSGQHNEFAYVLPGATQQGDQKETTMPHYMPPPRPPQPPIIHRPPPGPPVSWTNRPFPSHRSGQPNNDGCPVLLLTVTLSGGLVAAGIALLRAWSGL